MAKDTYGFGTMKNDKHILDVYLQAVIDDDHNLFARIRKTLIICVTHRKFNGMNKDIDLLDDLICSYLGGADIDLKKSELIEILKNSYRFPDMNQETRWVDT